MANELENRVSEHYKYLIDNIHQIINFMYLENQQKHLPLFYKVNNNIDRAKNIDFKDYLPELQKVITMELIYQIHPKEEN